MFECSFQAAELCARYSMGSHHVTPAVLDLLCHYARKLAGFVCGEVEEDGRLKCQFQRGGEGFTFDDGCLQKAVAFWLRIDIKKLRQAPLAITGIDKTVVFEMVVGI